MRSFLAPLLLLATSLLSVLGDDLPTAEDGMDAPAIVDTLDAKGFDVSLLDELLAAQGADSLVKRSPLCSIACKTLNLAYGDRLILQSETAQYDGWTANFWSDMQAQVNPYCIFQPKSNLEVSVLVLISRLSQCPFAAKSGGHAAFAGASSIEGGITVDLRMMMDVSVSEDKKVAYIQPGNQWYDVYTKLEPLGLAVIGGRVAEIGTGGLTLGGGISFFSNIYGWACDNVVSYELVTATGAIVTVTKDKYPDLYWALRGGGNNFGIVTKFGLATFDQGKMWGGVVMYAPTERDATLHAYINFGFNSPDDPKAALILVTGFSSGFYFTIADLEYTDPISTAPGIFQEFVNIPHLSDTTGTKSLSEIALEFNSSNPHGLRESYWTATFKLDYELAAYITELFLENTAPIENVAGIVPACVMQVITEGVLTHMADNGGNALGLDPAKGPYLLLNLAYMWTNAADDAAVIARADTIIKAAIAKSKGMGLDADYLYMNYASQYQDVIASYGAENKAKLVSISEKYDPAGVFQQLQPGYFKLSGPPTTGP